MKYEKIITIKSVDIVSGESVKPNYVERIWSSNMQKISIEEEPAFFIENTLGNSFSSSRNAWNGIDLKPYENKKILVETYDALFHPKKNGIWIKYIQVI